MDNSAAAADHQAEVLEKAANMVLEIALDLDQQRRSVAASNTRRKHWFAFSNK
jgi:hypothetical protein